MGLSENSVALKSLNPMVSFLTIPIAVSLGAYHGIPYFQTYDALGPDLDMMARVLLNSKN